MSNNIPFKNQKSPNIDSSFYNEVKKIEQNSFMMPNLPQQLSQSFYKSAPPLSPSAQNLDLIHQPNSSLLLNRYVNSPYATQTPVMSSQNPAPRVETPMMFGEAKSPQANEISFYNPKSSNNITNKVNSFNSQNENLTLSRNTDIEPKYGLPCR